MLLMDPILDMHLRTFPVWVVKVYLMPVGFSYALLVLYIYCPALEAGSESLSFDIS